MTPAARGEQRARMVYPRIPRTVAHVRDHYDGLDAAYREIWGDYVHHGYWAEGGETPARAVEALVDLVIARLDPDPGGALCDIGCGYGATAAYILKTHDVAITGLTVSSAQAAVGAGLQPLRGRFTCIERDWLANDFPDASFDHAYAIESSEHFADKAAFFAEAWRTMKPGGRLVVCAWLSAETPSRWQVDHLLEPICREGALPSMGSRTAYDVLARDAGFVPVAFDDISAQVRRTWAICGRRLAARLVTSARYRRMAIDATAANRAFILSIPRLWWALRSGAMIYGVLVWRKPA
ncbi:class I SAM-dependent methyltransferase [Sphingomonas sp. SUN019]|uniref:class I SAM-dependent methyltransferase n=1 Tax=Sphingomonas sp. SUN019 TaxID=2937788 RepID=UPI002164790D|nr:class I SAM-dependent methyltransferase [Sphingomonas sp. SUN019]UVO50911.1 class I SAM-dependent methyltransferase [Sphingomonas sp. SUN019]